MMDQPLIVIIINMVLMAISGAFGAGVVWTTVRMTMKQYTKDLVDAKEELAKDIEEGKDSLEKMDKINQEAHAEIVRSNQAAHNEIRRRQGALRGEINGSKPVFLPRDEFFDKYADCGEFKHNITESISGIRSRNIQKDQNWIELKYLLIQLAKKQDIDVPESFGK